MSPGSPVHTRNDTSSALLAAAFHERLRELLTALAHLVDPDPEPTAGEQQRARVDDRDHEQRRPEPSREVEAPRSVADAERRCRSVAEQRRAWRAAAGDRVARLRGAPVVGRRRRGIGIITVR